ncbi:MAG: hypothetical protein K2H18_07775 [Muribaculaceae bacterium]|nr:hypothetical protein [Muribaculaceae bacterium]
MSSHSSTYNPFVLLAITIIALTAYGCRRVNNVVWSKYSDLPEEGWDPINVIPFFPWPEDSLTTSDDRYSVLLSVRFSSIDTPTTLHLAVNQESDTGFIHSDTIAVPLLPPVEKVMGRGAYGVFETVDTIIRGVTLQPGYCVELQSLSAPENTVGIKDIGLVLLLENENQQESFFKKLQNFSIE